MVPVVEKTDLAAFFFHPDTFPEQDRPGLHRTFPGQVGVQEIDAQPRFEIRRRPTSSDLPARQPLDNSPPPSLFSASTRKPPVARLLFVPY